MLKETVTDGGESEGACKEKREEEGSDFSLYGRKGEEPLDDPGGHQSLLRVQVGRRLVDQVNIGWFPQTQSESDSLQLTTRQVLHLRRGEARQSALSVLSFANQLQ